MPSLPSPPYLVSKDPISFLVVSSAASLLESSGDSISILANFFEWILPSLSLSLSLLSALPSLSPHWMRGSIRGLRSDVEFHWISGRTQTRDLPLSVTMTSGSPNCANNVLSSSITAVDVAVLV